MKSLGEIDATVLKQIEGMKDDDRLSLAAVYDRWAQTIRLTVNPKGSSAGEWALFKIRPEHLPALRYIKQKHFRRKKYTIFQIAPLAAAVGLANPLWISQAITCMVNQRDAEGMNSENALRAVLAAATRNLRKPKARLR